MPRPRLPRSDRDLLTALERNLALLREYAVRAFADGDAAFYGEVAGKLRVLVYRSRTNRPLLLSLMEKLGVEIPLVIDDPFGSYQVTLPQYLDALAVAIRTPSQGLVELSNRDLIALWAQQYGASHEDWQIDEALASVLSLSSQLSIGGLPAAAAALRAITKSVLWVGQQFLARLADTPDSGSGDSKQT